MVYERKHLSDCNYNKYALLTTWVKAKTDLQFERKTAAIFKS